MRRSGQGRPWPCSSLWWMLTGSIGASQRMKGAKGPIVSQRMDSCQKRDKIGMVALRLGPRPGMSVKWQQLEFVVPGIIALTAMIASFNGAGTRLNVDRFYFRSFDECLMAPISLLPLLIGKPPSVPS